MKSIILAVVMIMALATSAMAWTVEFAWEPITDPLVKNVKLYQSTVSTAPKPWTLVATSTGPNTGVKTPSGLGSGTYFWYVTAIGTNPASESVPSNVVTANLPLAQPLGLVMTVLP